MKASIVGGGIGGLTTALALHQAGIPCRIFESVQELRELGVGVNLLPHALMDLEQMGLPEDLRKIAIETSELCYFNKFGQLIWQEERPPRGFSNIEDVIPYPELEAIAQRHKQIAGFDPKAFRQKVRSGNPGFLQGPKNLMS